VLLVNFSAFLSSQRII